MLKYANSGGACTNLDRFFRLIFDFNQSALTLQRIFRYLLQFRETSRALLSLSLAHRIIQSTFNSKASLVHWSLYASLSRFCECILMSISIFRGRSLPFLDRQTFQPQIHTNLLIEMHYASIRHLDQISRTQITWYSLHHCVHSQAFVHQLPSLSTRTYHLHRFNSGSS